MVQVEPKYCHEVALSLVFVRTNADMLRDRCFCLCPALNTLWACELVN